MAKRILCLLFRTFSAAGIDWLIVAMPFLPTTAQLEGADRVVKEHPDHCVIVLTHSYLTHTGRDKSGIYIWEKLVKRRRNISMVVCGHLSTVHFVSQGDHGNMVYEMLFDWQNDKKPEPNSYVAILEFDPEAAKLSVKSYSPTPDKYMTDQRSQFEFRDVDFLKAKAATPTRSSVLIDGAFPAGNILVDRIDGDDARVSQDLRDTAGWWFYWHFRVRQAGGRTIRFHFTNQGVFGPQGPAYSLDGGANWLWLGAKRSNTDQPPPKDGFLFRFPADATDVRFCFAIPYVESDLGKFLRCHGSRVALKTGVLCKTAKGRSAEVLYLGRLEGQADYRIALTCRHHACESVASYVLEGLIEAVLAEDDTGRWFRHHVAVAAIPFVDKDGVEAGDQGKNRQPHDHNRDYDGQSIYPTVAAIKKFLPEWSGGHLDMAIDLHCPYIHDNLIQFIGGQDQGIWQRTLTLSQYLESCQTGPLRHDAKRNVPFGTSWNQGNGLKSATFAAWAGGLPKIQIATTIEIPYSQVGQTPQSADAARRLGRDLAVAIKTYLENEPRPGIVPSPAELKR